MFSKYITQSLSFYGSNKVGDSLVRIITDARFVNNFFIKSMFMVVQNIILLIWFIATALVLNSHLFLISLLIFPIFTIVLGIVGRKIKKYSKRIQAQTSILFSNIEEKLNNMRIVKAFAREDYEMEKFISINTKFFKSWRKARLYRAVNVPLSEFNGTIMGIIVLLFGHFINLSIALLGAYVHTMRLTFVEFYKNAGFTGGGKKYKPFGGQNG